MGNLYINCEKALFHCVLCLIVSLSSYLLVTSSKPCNEAVCASIVSKCMLTQSCKCDPKNTTCSKDCFLCLDFLYADCCSCVEMCPPTNNSEMKLNRMSHVEALQEPFPDLFSVLMEERDSLQRWTSHTFPVMLNFLKDNKEIRYLAVTENTTTAEQEVLNCTVAYMAQCMPWNKCKDSCSSIGASSYRWFHDGCCECVGQYCIEYGINESKCIDCPLGKSDMTEEELNLISKEKVPTSDESTEDSLKEETKSQKKDDTDSLKKEETSQKKEEKSLSKEKDLDEMQNVDY